jgi:hypothetical protein
VEGFKCHKLGHYQNDCPDWEGNANYAEFDDDEEMLLMAHNDQQTSGKNHLWFLDSGCSNHMIGEKEWFFDFDNSYKDSVKLGDDSRMSVMGKGSVKLHINNIVYVISDVYYVPGLKTNLLSIGQLQQKQVTVIFKNESCISLYKGHCLLLMNKRTPFT